MPAAVGAARGPRVLAPPRICANLYTEFANAISWKVWLVSPATRARVLIADDCPAFVTALERLLALDYEVVGSAVDGQTTIEATHRLRPDVVVLDVNMPNGNGLEACRQITLAMPHVKVVVVTAMNDEGITEAAFAAGACAFVPKHAVGQDLPIAIRRVWADRQSAAADGEHPAPASGQ